MRRKPEISEMSFIQRKFLLAKAIGRFEFHNLAGLDPDLLFRTGIDTFTCRLLLHGECAETNELHLVVVSECLIDRFEHCVKSLLGVYLAETGLGSDFIYEICLVHNSKFRVFVMFFYCILSVNAFQDANIVLKTLTTNFFIENLEKKHKKTQNIDFFPQIENYFNMF